MARDPFRKFNATELRRFLAAIDRHLDAPARMIIIGGSAAALAYGVELVTKDIDTFETNLAPLERAIEKARAETALNIPIEDVGIADAPYEYQSRTHREMTELRKLGVFVPDPYDWC
jgi:Nucleotidyltransferase of unknown function (DUF6036)